MCVWPCVGVCVCVRRRVCACLSQIMHSAVSACSGTDVPIDHIRVAIAVWSLWWLETTSVSPRWGPRFRTWQWRITPQVYFCLVMKPFSQAHRLTPRRSPHEANYRLPLGIWNTAEMKRCSPSQWERKMLTNTYTHMLPNTRMRSMTILVQQSVIIL